VAVAANVQVAQILLDLACCQFIALGNESHPHAGRKPTLIVATKHGQGDQLADLGGTAA
jgi:hypothetical protein